LKTKYGIDNKEKKRGRKESRSEFLPEKTNLNSSNISLLSGMLKIID
jgi:hypothetical protein